MQIKKIYRNEARPRPYRPAPADRGPGAKWGPADIGAADVARYQKLKDQAQKFNDDPRGYVERKWANRVSNMLYATSAGYSAGYFSHPAKKMGDRIYSIMMDFSLEGLPDYLVARFLAIMAKVATKEGLFVNNDSKYGSNKLYVALSYEGDLPHTSREGDALAADLAKRTVNVVRKVNDIINAEKDRKFGKTSEARLRLL